LENGVVTELSFELTPLASFTVSGLVVDAISGEGIPDAQVVISNEAFSFEGLSGESGEIDFSMFYNGV